MWQGFPSEQHGRTWHTWYLMIWRCKQTEGRFYKYYGSRGIQVCERWMKFENFLADMGYKPAGKSIDRIDNNKGYSPENCRWATSREQGANTRKARLVQIGGECIPINEIVRRYNVGQSTVRYWLTKGDDYCASRVASLQV